MLSFLCWWFRPSDACKVGFEDVHWSPGSVTSLHSCGSCSSSRNPSGHMGTSYWGRGWPLIPPFSWRHSLLSSLLPRPHLWMVGVERLGQTEQQSSRGGFLGPAGTFNPDRGWKASPCSLTTFSSRGFLLALWVISPSLKVLGLGDPNSSCQPPWASWEDDWATENCTLFPSSGFHSFMSIKL